MVLRSPYRTTGLGKVRSDEVALRHLFETQGVIDSSCRTGTIVKVYQVVASVRT